MSSTFVHLRIHSEFSIIDSVVRIPALAARLEELGMPAAAITEQTNLFSAIKFYRAAQGRGIKPIIGADLRLKPEAGARRPPELLLLCQNYEGYRNLSRLITRAYLEGERDDVPLVEPAWVEEFAEGLIALSGGCQGDVGQALLAGATVQARHRAERWQAVFPERYYMEVQRTGRAGEDDYLAKALDLAWELDLPVVATNDVRFLHADDFDAHEARICIHEGRALADPRRQKRYSREQYLRSEAEMQALFADIPAALENSVEIARRCNVEFQFGTYHLPEFPVPEGMDAAEWFARKANEGLAQRLSRLIPADATDADSRRARYQARLDEELEVINKMGFPGYYLIVADFIGWARDNGIPVGPGRGSGAGSLAAYALGITDLDPLAYDLLFERFLNPERVSMPDFDVDFCMERRDEVIEYVARRYGRDRVSGIITYGSMAAKAVVRDVGRVLGMPYGFVDQVAKLIPFAVDQTLDNALVEEPALKERYDNEEEVRFLLDLARQLEGLKRNAGRHAGGVVISPLALTEYMPLYAEQGGGATVSQFDMSDVETIGLVKFDFLGLRTLTIIDWAVRDINRRRQGRGEAALDIVDLPLDDRAAYDLVRRASTTAVFQLESRGMKDLIKRLQPDVFEDLIALVALYRPGPLQSGMVDDFIDRKHGRARVQYPHPELEAILQPTYGVILYQEQVMQIAQVLAGYTLGAADLLRRAMGKKKPEEMAKQRSIFIAGATGRGVDEEVAAGIFDLMEKFAGYGFNKSHSAAYALVAYQTAWLKAHYPAAFMAAVLSADMDNTDKVVTLIDECRQLDQTVMPPDVNRCSHMFTVGDDDTILYGLGAIKGVGGGAIDAIISERDANGPFSDLFDLCRRIDLRRANRRVLEALIKAGAMDHLGPSRRAMFLALEEALALAEQASRDAAAGQDDLFGLGDSVGTRVPAASFKQLEEWPDDERLGAERDTLGLYLTGHPLDRFRGELAGLVSSTLADLKPGGRRVAGLVQAVRSMRTRRGRMAFVTLDDGTARSEIAIYGELIDRCQDQLVRDRILIVEGECKEDDFTNGHTLTAQRVYDIEAAREEFARRVIVRVGVEQAGNGFCDALAEIITPQCGGRCPVDLEYERPGARARLRLGEGWAVHPTEALLDNMRARFGAEQVEIEYATGAQDTLQ